MTPNQAQVFAATLDNGGSGGTDGTQTVTVLGGVIVDGGNPAQVSVTVLGGTITAVLSVLYIGDYVELPENPAPVAGAGLVGASLGLVTNAYAGDPDFLT